VSLPVSLSSVVTDMNIQFGSVTDTPKAATENSNCAELTGQDLPSLPALNCTAQISDFERMI
jgi:hypothetical protein